jgi:hypothetical protein
MGAPRMIRLQALRVYKREFLHAIRNGKTEAQAADIGMTKTKEAVLNDFAGLDEHNALAKWADICEGIVDFQILLRGIPIDRSAIPPKGEMAQSELDRMEEESSELQLDFGKGEEDKDV